MEVAAPVSSLTTVRDISQVGEARRAAMLMGKQRGMGEEAVSSVGILVTELATNVVRHAGEGTLALRWKGQGDTAGIEVVALDKGPGMYDVARCMEDGYSSRGTAGNGLGAVRRLSHEFDIHSAPGQGTAIVARLNAGIRPRVVATRRMPWAVYCTPAQGETVCGDLWRVDGAGDVASILVADGLGHGPSAATASEAVGRAYDRDPHAMPSRVLESAHREAQSTRGAAVAVARIELGSGAVRYAGVGNIAGAIVVPGVSSRGLFSHNGTLGANVRKFQDFDYVLPAGGLLIMHSDGMQTRWSLDAYPGLARRDPALVAAVLGRDFKRGTDDLTVVVARLEGGP